MAKIAYIGVGNMGRAMILRLLKAGHKVTAYNRTREKAKMVEAAGAKLAAEGEYGFGRERVNVINRKFL